MEFSDPLNPTNEELSHYLCGIIPKEQIDKVFSGDASASINCGFMGFVQYYWHLSKMLPKDTIIYDFGCGYNAQSFFFVDFKSYHAIDILADEMFCAPNCTTYKCSASEFLNNYIIEHDSFAIVNFVPCWEENVIDLVHERFQNCFTYYPCEL
jgi:hypothetical protein